MNFDFDKVNAEVIRLLEALGEDKKADIKKKVVEKLPLIMEKAEMAMWDDLIKFIDGLKGQVKADNEMPERAILFGQYVATALESIYPQVLDEAAAFRDELVLAEIGPVDSDLLH